MNMKKFSALLLALSMVLSLAACGGKSTDQSSDDSQSGSEAAASELHLGYDLNTGENYYGPYYDDWSEKTDDELYEEALTEDTTINIYATSSKMMKVEESFEEAYPGLDLVVFDLDNDEVLSKAKIEARHRPHHRRRAPDQGRQRATCSTSGTIRTFWSLTSPRTSALTSTRKT